MAFPFPCWSSSLHNQRRVNCIHYQQGTKVLFSSMFIPELRGSADNDNSLVFRPFCLRACVYHKRAGRKVAFTQCEFLVVPIANTPRGDPSREPSTTRKIGARKGMLARGWMYRAKREKREDRTRRNESYREGNDKLGFIPLSLSLSRVINLIFLVINPSIYLDEIRTVCKM